MEANPIDRSLLLNLTLIVESLLLLAATFWSHLSGIALKPHLCPDARHLLLGAAAGAGLALISFALLWLGQRFSWFAGLREITYQQIGPLFAQLQLGDIFVVAAVSGFCEEVIFRGVMQEQFGIWTTSIIFALFHCPNFSFLSYGLWAWGAGLFLGGLYAYTGNLWCPILAHAVSNCLSLIYLRQAAKTDDSKIIPKDK